MRPSAARRAAGAGLGGRYRENRPAFQAVRAIGMHSPTRFAALRAACRVI